MKNWFWLFLLGLAIPLRGEETLQTFESLSPNIQVQTEGEWVYVHLKTHDSVTGPRIIHAWVGVPTWGSPEAGKAQAILEYYFINNWARSKRPIEDVEVTWKISKTDWDAWDRGKLYVRRGPLFQLGQDDIDLIKSQW